MDTADETCSAVTVANGAFPVRRTEELLLPVLTDDSLQAAMNARRAPAVIPDLRLVLLGRKGAGKSAAGNTILGAAGGFESGKPTEECVKRRAEVAGRKVTVVDTPGWEWYYPLNSTPNWVRRETLRSVSLCPPGPHAVLLVVRSCASVPGNYIQEIEEHLEPLGKGVWEHVMLLFTRGDELGLLSMEQRILSGGPGLKKLLEKCGNRYQVVNNRNKGDEAQVGALLRKVEQMVEGKKEGGNYLEMDISVVSGLEADAKRRARERRKKQRQMETQMQRGIIRAALMSDGPQGSDLDAHQSFSKAARRLPEVRLVLLGERVTGKSSAGNAILGKPDFFQAGAVTEECTRQQAEVAMRLVTVVDTPGWEEGVAGATPERVKREIASSVSMCPPGPHALLLTLRVDTLVRAGHVREHLELLGDGVWRHTILLFTHGDQLREGVDIERHIQSGGRDLQLLLDKCRGRHHVFCSAEVAGRQRGGAAQVTELLEKVERMVSRNRCEAFSGLVQEVLVLSRQRNDKFHQRLRDMGDKMARQEAELKNMRDREMKSIRWIFDRKKKVKSPGKADIQREEEDEDRRIGERKNDFGELEERMRWLTEDKEREYQDLSIENNRIQVALNQSRKERDEATLSIEQKDREIEELKERNDEQQLKLLDLERACVENERERKQREDAITAEKLTWREEATELHKKEKAEWVENVNSLKAEIEETKRHCNDVLKKTEQDKDRAMTEMEQQLLEHDKKYQELQNKASEEKQKALAYVKQCEKDIEMKLEEIELQKQETERKMQERSTEIEEMRLRHQEDMNRKLCETEKMMETVKAEHREKMDQLLKEKADSVEQVKQQHAIEIRNMEQEKEREILKLKEQLTTEKEKQIAEIEQKNLADVERIMFENEKGKEMLHLKHKTDLTQKIEDKENEIEALKLQHQRELARKINEMEKAMEARIAEHQEEMDRKMRKESEESVEKVQQQYREQIRDMGQESQRETEHIKEQFEKEIEKHLHESQTEIRELEQKYVSQIRENMLEHEKEKETINQNNEKVLKERDRLTEALKRQHMDEMEDRMKESETEKEIYKKVMGEKEKAMEEMKQKVNELHKMLQEKEEKETDNLNYKGEMDRRLEEKEKEIQQANLHVKEMKKKLQEKEEREQDGLNYMKEMEQTIEGKEREIEELKEHLKQVEQSLQQTEKDREKDQLNHKRQIEQKLEENQQVMDKISEILQIKEDERGEITLDQCKEAEQRLRDREREMEDRKQQLLNETERKVKEKEAEVERVKEQADSREARWKEEQRKKDEEGESETNRLREAIDKKTQEVTQAECLLAQRDREMEEAKKTCAHYLTEIQALTESNQQQTSSMMVMQQRHAEQESRSEAETMAKLQEKDEELHRLRQRDREQEKEVGQLRLTIEQTKAELKELTGKMEKEMTNMIQEYDKEIARMKEKDNDISRQEEQSRKSVLDITKKYEESQKIIEELQQQNKKVVKEVENLKVKYEQLEKDSEEEVKKLLKRYEEQVESRESEIQSSLDEKDQEVRALKEAHDKLTVELEMSKEREEEAGRKMRELREHYETQLIAEREEIQEKFLEREKEVGQRERDICRNVDELSKRELKLDAKEGKVESKEQELRKLEASLQIPQREQEEKYKREFKTKAQSLEEKERALEGLLRSLEGQQKLLSSHGQDLQKKVRGLKDQGKELKDREHCLKHEEQQLLSFKSELQLRHQVTAQQLDDMRRDLALLKEELRRKEDNLKMALRKLSKWEESLKAREAHLCNSEQTGAGQPDDRKVRESDAAAESSEDAFHLTCRVREGTERDASDTREATNTESNNRPLEPPREAGTEGGRREGGEEVEEEQRVRDRGHGNATCTASPAPRLRVLLLGESWSSRSPAGLTVLGGEAAKPDGRPFRSWRGQTTGRHVVVGEPLGLRWRDGPAPADAAQRSSLLHCLSWCRPGPDVVLLLLPAFLTCTQKYRRAVEEHVGLLGEEAWQRTLVLFTWGETLGVSAEQHILRNGELMRLIDRCGGRYHVLTGSSGAEGLLEKMEDMLGWSGRGSLLG